MVQKTKRKQATPHKRGQATPLETIERFRAHYLYCGVASESAREVGIPERTGRDIAAKLAKDPAFAEARRELRSRTLDELVAMRMRVATKALQRFEDDSEPTMSEGETNVVDRRPDFGRLVLEAEKNAHNLAKIERPLDDANKPSEVHITVTGPGGAST